MPNDRKLQLYTGPSTFRLIVCLKARVIALTWIAETSAVNMLWVRCLTIRLGWPPIRWTHCFTDIDEAPEGN